MNNIYFPVHNKIGTMLDVLSFHFSVQCSQNSYFRLLNSSVSGIRVFCGDFRKMLRILNGIIVLFGHLQKFWGNLLTL